MEKSLNIAITGASGFIGSHLLKALKNDYLVSGFSESTNDSTLNIVKKSYSSPEDIKDFIACKDVLIFASGPVDPRGVKEDSESIINENLILLRRFTESFFNQNPNGKFIFLSSAGALYDSKDPSTKNEDSSLIPLGFYGELKLRQENFLRKTFTENVTILRLTNVYGDPFKKNQTTGLIDKLIQSLYTSKVTEIFVNLQSERDYLYIDDLCHLVRDLVKKSEKEFAVYNVSSHENLSVEKIIAEINKTFAPKQAPVNIKSTTNVADRLVVHSDKLRCSLNWHPQATFRENLLKIKKSMEHTTWGLVALLLSNGIEILGKLT